MSTFHVLTVCTGNICRSPLAEQVLRARLGETGDVEFSSAGTHALIAKPMDDRAAAYSRRFGADPSAHLGRQLTIEHIRASDLILAMSREHRRAVVELLPRASRFTFTVREFARLLAEVDDFVDEEIPVDPDGVASGNVDDVPSRLAMLVENAAAVRGMTPPASPDDDDIIDPYRQNDEVYAASVDQLLPAVESIAAALQRALAGVRE